MIRFIVVALIFLSVSVSHGWGVPEPKIYHYSIWERDGKNSVLIHRYRFIDRELAMKFSEEWSSFESDDGNLIRLGSRTNSENIIEITMIKLSNIPDKEPDAIDLYGAEVKKIFPTPVIRKARLDQRYVPKTGLFPITYSLAASEKAPLNMFCTFFIQTPYLYSVNLKTPNRLDIAKMFTEYSAIVCSMTVLPPAPKSPESVEAK